jgi:hypothetical protein
MTVTYPPPTKTKRLRPALPPIAPTPALRADAALVEAIAAFKSMARSAGMIGIFLIWMSFYSLLGFEQYFWPLIMPIILSILAASMSLSFAAVDLTPASKRTKYFSGVGEDQRRPGLWGWVRWAAFAGSFVLGYGILFNHKALGFEIGQATALSTSILIIGQLISILMDMLQGVKLLRFARAQLEE